MHCLFRAGRNEVQTVSTVNSRRAIYHERSPGGDGPLSQRDA